MLTLYIKDLFDFTKGKFIIMNKESTIISNKFEITLNNN